MVHMAQYTLGLYPQNLKQTPKKSVQQKFKFLASWSLKIDPTEVVT